MQISEKRVFNKLCDGGWYWKCTYCGMLNWCLVDTCDACFKLKSVPNVDYSYKDDTGFKEEMEMMHWNEEDYCVLKKDQLFTDVEICGKQIRSFVLRYCVLVTPKRISGNCAVDLLINGYVRQILILPNVLKSIIHNYTGNIFSSLLIYKGSGDSKKLTKVYKNVNIAGITVEMALDALKQNYVFGIHYQNTFKLFFTSNINDQRSWINALNNTIITPQ